MRGDLRHDAFRAAAAVLFAAILALVFAISDPRQAASVLFVIPVALLALSDGVRGGAIGAAVAVALTATWVLADDVPLTVLGWASRITAFTMIGALVGHYEDLARSYQRRRMDEQYAAELHDRVIQSLVVARYQLQADGQASDAVDEALAGAKEIISERLGEVQPGDLRLSGR
jgi:signal transduction histidine kinase